MYAARWNVGSRRRASRKSPTDARSRAFFSSAAGLSAAIWREARPQLLSACTAPAREASHSTAARYFSHASSHSARAAAGSAVARARSPSAMPWL